MSGANLIFAGFSVLFAAEPPSKLGASNGEQFLPYAIGAVCAIGVILVGLVICRRSTASPRIEETPAEGKLPPIYLAPNQLWSLVLPTVSVLGLGAATIFYVIPHFQDLDRTTKELQSPTYIPSVQFQRPTAFDFKPTPLPPPQINPPPFVPPPPPRVPQYTVDSKGFVHKR